MKFTFLFLSLIFILSCNHPKKYLTTKESLSFIGKETGYEKQFLKEPEWVLFSQPINNNEYKESYVYSKKDFPKEYVSIDKCNENNTICRINYSITEEEYLKIPTELQKLNFELLDENESNGTHHITYIKSETYNISAILNKTKENSLYHYWMEISTLVLPIELLNKIRNKNLSKNKSI